MPIVPSLISEWLIGTSCVQTEEKERIMNFVFKKDAKSALIGRLLMRKVISDFTKIRYNEVILKRTDKGKPFLANDATELSLRRFNFNISHQGDFTVLAAEPELQVGVDVMKTTYPISSTVPGFFHTMRKQFTGNEWEAIKSQPSEWNQLQMFYRHWCLKESYVKATGTGIGRDLQSVEFQINTKELSPQHQVAVALGPSHVKTKETRMGRSSFTILQFADLVSSAIPLFSEDESDWIKFQAKKEKS
ncbi:L-aminoadipate-semialdehyde dehydrogenase-phosphopantetheinyl transferase-like isoform X4 [Stylophora pistillata]|uniref:L-aminoadipate-semialdehyde dehydrogenase-phosphopantetheinyl transferase-like isoform X4 n=1 Tax=Stylophora pistillata TaxID=50429 RepID=UPI000C057401|nr:L-aminoadipate-semialdehyde dehydrogenase-phosphopantetheinyl transferase-like isoform X4 [Stylophora pistillata]